MEKIKGKVWKFADNIDTDVIIPGRYLRIFSMDELASHAMEGIDPDFAKKVEKGDVIVAGQNFGCGSSREQAPVALKHLGVSAIIAKSFARIFYRNAINIGLPVVIAEINVSNGDILEIDLENGTIINLTKDESFIFEPFKKFMLDILKKDGIVSHYLENKE